MYFYSYCLFVCLFVVVNRNYAWDILLKKKREKRRGDFRFLIPMAILMLAFCLLLLDEFLMSILLHFVGNRILQSNNFPGLVKHALLVERHHQPIVLLRALQMRVPRRIIPQTRKTKRFPTL